MNIVEKNNEDFEVEEPEEDLHELLGSVVYDI